MCIVGDGKARFCRVYLLGFPVGLELSRNLYNEQVEK